MRRRPPRSTQSRSSAASDVYKRQEYPIRKADYADPDAELPFTADGKLDVRELCYTELVLEVPTVLLCIFFFQAEGGIRGHA